MLKRTLPVLLLAVLGLQVLATTHPPEFEAKDVRYFLRRADCGGDDQVRLSRALGADSERCAFLAGPANEVLVATGSDPLTESWLQEDLDTYVLDGAGTLRGQVSTTNWLANAASKGYLIVDVKVTATAVGDFLPITLVDITEETVLTSAPHVTSFEADIDDALDGVEVDRFNVDVTIRGVNGLHTSVKMSGDSYIIVPTLVEVTEEAA